LSWIKEKNNSVVLSVYAVPGSSRTEIVGTYGNALKIKLKASPVDGAANKELVNFLAKKLKISKSNIKIISGLKQKRKVLSLSNCNKSKIQSLSA